MIIPMLTCELRCICSEAERGAHCNRSIVTFYAGYKSFRHNIYIVLIKKSDQVANSKLKMEPPAGLEPAIPGSLPHSCWVAVYRLGGRCLIHWATGALDVEVCLRGKSFLTLLLGHVLYVTAQRLRTTDVHARVTSTGSPCACE